MSSGEVSPPSRGRGLKPPDWASEWQEKRVAPLAGAWIETDTIRVASSSRTSPPSRGRGLKRSVAANWTRGRRSPPSRGRGLKLYDGVRSASTFGGVAPLAGAWIETFCRSRIRGIILVAPLAGAWIETSLASRATHRPCRPPRGGEPPREYRRLVCVSQATSAHSCHMPRPGLRARSTGL